MYPLKVAYEGGVAGMKGYVRGNTWHPRVAMFTTYTFFSFHSSRISNSTLAFVPIAAVSIARLAGSDASYAARAVTKYDVEELRNCWWLGSNATMFESQACVTVESRAEPADPSRGWRFHEHSSVQDPGVRAEIPLQGRRGPSGRREVQLTVGADLRQSEAARAPATMERADARANARIEGVLGDKACGRQGMVVSYRRIIIN
jgi:hypothetical protein